MTSDFTRSTFRPGKHYSGVRMQQGRVQLDADWNEQIDLQAHRVEAETRDVIGGCGTLIGEPGFKITVDVISLPDAEHTDSSKAPLPQLAKGDFLIGPGRYYVDGILCENENYVRYTQQPDWPGVEPVKASSQAGLELKPVSGTDLYLAYLDVWTRHLTALEDDSMREVALGGPDTATRTKTVWQVKLLGPFDPSLHCLSKPRLWQDLLDSTQNGKNGKLSARAEESAGADGPCVVPPGAGYRRLENQLYRVEIHEVDARGAIKLLKWSRDNGSIVTRWLNQESSTPHELIVSSIGRDDVLKFGPGQYVEVSDDQRELRGEAGILVRLAKAEDQVLTLDTTDSNAATVLKADFPDQIAGRPNNPKARRWDGAQAPVVGWFELEDGVQIKFEKGKYHVGDYWLIPARTATADVEWPRQPDKTPIPQPRAGVEHHFCKLAILRRNAIGFEVVQDCRALFPPLTALTTLLYESGDGQEARPGNPVPQPLCVRVVNGQAPVIGAAVQFTVEAGGGAGGGTLTVAQPVITQAPDGVAACGWTLGNAASGRQRVRAELLDAAGHAIPGQVLHFNASLNQANLLYVGGDGQEAMPNGRLPQPLRVRVINEQAPVIGAHVRFKVTLGNGSLPTAEPAVSRAPSTPPPDPQAVVTQENVTVSPDGIAECAWTLGATGPQQVEAVLLDADGSKILGQILEFNANVSAASQVAYDPPPQCTNLSGAKTVQDAIDILCQKHGGCCVCVGSGGNYERLDVALSDLIAKGERDICICLLHGDQETGEIEISDYRDLHIQIAGCGPGSRVTLRKPIKFSHVNSVVLRDFAIETTFVAGADDDGDASAITFDHCVEVSLRACHLSGSTLAGKGALLSIANAHRVWLHGNVFEARLPDSLAPTLTVFESVATASKVTSPVAHTPNPGQSAFRQAALEVAQKLATLEADPREKLQTALEKTVAEQRMILSQGEILGHAKLAALLHETEVNSTTAFDLLLDLRRAAIKARPGTAIVLEQPPRVGEPPSSVLPQLVNVLDQDNSYLVENNDIAGVLSLYGPPAAIALSNQLSDVKSLEQLSRWLKDGQYRLSNRFLGTLQMRGNQLVRVAVARKIVDELISAVDEDEPVSPVAEKQSFTLGFELFGRCQWGNNVFEGGRSLVVCRHLTLQASEFTQFAEPLGTPGMDGANEPAIAGTVIADSTIYVANHGSGNMTLRNLSRLTDQVANQEISIS